MSIDKDNDDDFVGKMNYNFSTSPPDINWANFDETVDSLFIDMDTITFTDQEKKEMTEALLGMPDEDPAAMDEWIAQQLSKLSIEIDAEVESKLKFDICGAADMLDRIFDKANNKDSD